MAKYYDEERRIIHDICDLPTLPNALIVIESGSGDGESRTQQPGGTQRGPKVQAA